MVRCHTKGSIIPHFSSNSLTRASEFNVRRVLVSANMGVGENDILSRLDYVHKDLSGMKNSPLALVQMFIQNTVTPILPVSVSRQAIFDIFARHSMVFTNVPGPAKPVAFAGKEVTEVQILFANLVTQVSMISYRGTVSGNFCLDADAIPNSQSLAPLYVNAFVKLAQRLDVEVPDSVLNACRT